MNKNTLRGVFFSSVWETKWDFQRKHQKWRRATKKTTEFLFLLVQSRRAEERFVVFVSLGSAAFHHFLSRLKTRASTLSKPVFTEDWNQYREGSLSGGNQSWMELRARIPGLLVLASVFPPAGKNRQRNRNQNFPDWNEESRQRRVGFQEYGNQFKPEIMCFFKDGKDGKCGES